MTALLVTICSILAISGGTWIAKKMLDVPICPICLGVGGTWLWMLIGRALGHEVDATMLSILLGGSVAGIAYQVEKRLPPGRSPMLWKMLFIPAGIIAAYALATPRWDMFAVMSVALIVLTAFFLFPRGTPGGDSEAVEALKKKMRQCC